MRKILLILFTLFFGLISFGQTISGFQINHNFLKLDSTIIKGLYCTVQLKSITKITSDSGVIVTINKFYENSDIADITPENNLIAGKNILINYMLYAFPSSETTYFYGKHIGKLTPVEAVIKEIIMFNYSINNGIKKSEIIK